MEDRAIVLARASTGKQVIEGDSIDDQIDKGVDFCKSKGFTVVKTFKLVESGRKTERDYFVEVMKFCMDKANHISWIVFVDIDRFTRLGGYDLQQWKDKLLDYGVQLQDIKETFRPPINLLENLGFEYSWSKIWPSRKEEFLQAEGGRDEATKILNRMIGKEIINTQSGYWQRTPPYGFTSEEIADYETGVKNKVLVPKLSNDKTHPHLNESFYIQKMFELRASHKYTDEEIVEKINGLGFRSRKRTRRDTQTKKIIGHTGFNQLTVKQFQRYITRPIYAGIICEVWTHHLPVVARFRGIISYEQFNDANRGKIVIERVSKDKVLLNYDRVVNGEPYKIRRLKRNPYFPYKNLILCPKCAELGIKRAMQASRPGGKQASYYHCQKNHKYFAINRTILHSEVEQFLDNLKFDDKLPNLFEEIFMRKWRLKAQEQITERRLIEDNINSLSEQQQAKLKEANNASQFTNELVKQKYIQEIEKEVLELENQIIDARKQRDKKEDTETEIKKYLVYARYLIEHPKLLLIDETNILKLEQSFGLIFNDLPTYTEIVNRTAKLEPLFKLNEQYAKGKIPIGDP